MQLERDHGFKHDLGHQFHLAMLLVNEKIFLIFTQLLKLSGQALEWQPDPRRPGRKNRPEQTGLFFSYILLSITDV